MNEHEHEHEHENLNSNDQSSQPEAQNVENTPPPSPAGPNIPKWAMRMGKLMIFFAVLGCLLLAGVAFFISSVIENALSGHGL